MIIIKGKSELVKFRYELLLKEPWVREAGYEASTERLDGVVFQAIAEDGPRAKAIAIEIAKQEYRKSLQGRLVPKARPK